MMQRFSPLLGTSDDDQEADDFTPKFTPSLDRKRKHEKQIKSSNDEDDSSSGEKKSTKCYKHHSVFTQRNMSPVDSDAEDFPKKSQRRGCCKQAKSRRENLDQDVESAEEKMRPQRGYKAKQAESYYYIPIDSESELESDGSPAPQKSRAQPERARQAQEVSSNSDQEFWSTDSMRSEKEIAREQQNNKQTNKRMHTETVSDHENEKTLSEKAPMSKKSKLSTIPDSESSDDSFSDFEYTVKSKNTKNPVRIFESSPDLEEDSSVDSSKSERSDEGGGEVEDTDDEVQSELEKSSSEKLRKNFQSTYSGVDSTSFDSEEDEEKPVRKTGEQRRGRGSSVDSDVLLWSTSASLTRGEAEEQKKDERRSKKEQIECEVCGRNIRCRAIMKRHMLTHTGEKPFQCSDCGRSYTSSSNLRIHQLSHSGKMDFSCEECGQKFTHLPYLKRHLLRHSGTRQHICDQCGKGFLQKYHLERHLLVHTRNMPYSCKKCNASFNRTDYLSLHMRNAHLDENCDNPNKPKPKSYKCDTCGKTFSSRASLEAHGRVHSGVKPYSCTICQRKFKQSSQVHTHMRTHAGEKPYPCDLCGLKFTRKHYVKFHKERKHGKHSQ